MTETSIKPKNNYTPGYAPAHIKNHTWRTAENSAAYLLPTLQSLAQANPRLSLLDVGAGPGTISASLARYVPQGTVTVTDISEEVISRAAEYAKSQGLTNMSFQTADIYALPFEDSTFDVVHAQQVLCHLEDPLQAMKELLRVSRGIVAVRESDMRMWTFYPPSPHLAEFSKVLCSTMASPNIGVELVSLVMRAGVPRAQITATMGTWCYSTLEEREMWGGVMRDRVRAGGMRQKILESDKEWTAKDLDQMADAWDDWIRAEDGCFGCMHGEVIVKEA